jgi:hypothetical protein
MTYLENLIVARDAILAQIATISAMTGTMDYSVDNQSVSNSATLQRLQASLEMFQALILAAEGPSATPSQGVF